MVAIGAALVGCGDNNNVTCGDGTTLVNGVCQANAGSGGDTTCGSGTMLQGTTCVPVSTDAAAPTISMITPDHAGAAGLVQFEIDGTGFAGDNVTSLKVYFGDTSKMNCEASIGPATPTVIVGEVPAFCDVNVMVSVITNLGTATTPFHYDAIFAADGDGGGTLGLPGELWVIDPYFALAFDFGPIEDASQTGYGIDGVAFDGSGTLWGVTTGDSPGDVNKVAQLVTIDPTTPNQSTVTVIGDLADVAGNDYLITDIKFVNGTLYGWGYMSNDGGSSQGIVTIDTTTGQVKSLAASQAISFPWGALAFDGTTTTVAANGAGSDSTDSATGELDTADLTTGMLTAGTTPLDWPVGAPVNAMDFLGKTMLGVIDNGTYGVIASQISGQTVPIYGETLAIIDPTATPVVSPVFELPAVTFAQSAIDGIAIPSSTTATLQIARKPMPRSGWQTLKSAGNLPLARR